MKTERFTAPPFEEHTYLIWDETTRDAFLVDPGGQETAVDQVIAENKLRLQGIYNTHGHIDHIARVAYFQRKYKIPFFIHVADAPMVKSVNTYGSFFGLGAMEVPTVDYPLKEGDVIRVGETQFTVFETPGHTPGGCVFYCAAEKLAVVGDVLFYASIGRTDLPGGDFDQLAASIRKKIYTLPDDTQVWSGHGEPTTVGYEKKHNPFVHA